MGTKTMAALPALPRSGRKARPVTPCACGCGRGTRGTWFPGDDGRSTGWAVRVERGLLTLADIPEDQGRAGAQLMLARREKERQAERKQA